MITLKRTNSDDQDFVDIIKYLDAELAIIDGEDHSFYAQYNKIDKIKHVIIAYQDELAIACGAIKEFSSKTMEIKRMYTLKGARGKGLASQVLSDLELWSKELGYDSCMLETGKRQEDAIALYQKNGYQIIPNYGQYIGVANSVCFEKELKS